MILRITTTLLLLICSFSVVADHDEHPDESYYTCITHIPNALGDLHEEYSHHDPAEVKNGLGQLVDSKYYAWWESVSPGYTNEKIEFIPPRSHVFNYTRTSTGVTTGPNTYNSPQSCTFYSCPAGELINSYTGQCQLQCPPDTELKYRQLASIAEQPPGLYCGVDNCRVQKFTTIEGNDPATRAYLDTYYTGEFCGDINEITPTSTTTTTNNDDGSTTDTTTGSDGDTTTTTSPDGTTSTTTPDGTTTTNSPDGTTTTESPDGTTTTEDPDGTTTTEDPDGTVTVTDPNGNTSTTDPNGNTTTSTPGGGSTITDPNGNTIEITDGDGNLVCDADPNTTAPDCSNDVCTDDPNTTQNECAGQDDNNGDGDTDGNGDSTGGSCTDDPNTEINECGAGDCDPTAEGYFDCIIGEIEDTGDSPYEFVDYADQIDLAKQALATELQTIRSNLASQYSTTVTGSGGLEDNIVPIMGADVNISLTNINPQILEMLRNIFYFLFVLSSGLILLGGFTKS